MIDIHQSCSLILKYRFQPLEENSGLIETNCWFFSQLSFAMNYFCSPGSINTPHSPERDTNLSNLLIVASSATWVVYFVTKCCHLRWRGGSPHLKCIQDSSDARRVTTYGQLLHQESRVLNTSSSPQHTAHAAQLTFYWLYNITTWLTPSSRWCTQQTFLARVGQ